MRDALSLTDQAIAFGSGELDEAGVRQMLGSVDRGHVFRLIEALAAAATARRWSTTVEALRAHGLSAAGTLEEMAALLQQMAVLQAVPRRASTRDDPDAADARAPGGAAAGRRDAAALQHRACTAAPSWAWRPTSTRR